MMSFQQQNSQKKFRLEYPESEAEPEFGFQLGSQKLEPKIGISNPDWRGGISGQDALEQQEDKRQQWRDKRHCNNQPANERQKGGGTSRQEAAVS